MLFSSITFIYYFIPLLILIYFIMPSKYKNLVLLIFSLIFYYFGEKEYTIILILSCIINYIFGLIIEKKHSKLVLTLGIITNVSLLFYFKYMDFFIININNIFNSNINFLHIVMPIGISFFTFQNMSYIIDVYRKDAKANHNFINYACYICMFSQLVAGPIVRYKDIDKELKTRVHSFDNYSFGISRFVIGLSKKVIIANGLAEAIKLIEGIAPSITSSWTIAIFFTLQIYYDFSGYSDMAIGLGKMLGFNFLENFNYPLIANSVTDFWHRWHISLSNFLRDYIYIPLGGNRVSKLKWIRNIFIVWFVTGFWHGASYNFIIWGLYFAVFLVIEKKYLSNYLKEHKLFAHIYTLFILIISFVIFNNTSLISLKESLKNMFFLNNLKFINIDIIYYLRSYFILFAISVIGCTPLVKKIYLKIKDWKIYKYIWILEPIILLILLVVVTSLLIDSSFNPFLYFRF